MDFGNPREVLPISKSKSDDFRAEEIKVDGVEIAGTDRNFDLPKVGEASVVQSGIALSVLTWYIQHGHKHLMAFFAF